MNERNCNLALGYAEGGCEYSVLVAIMVANEVTQQVAELVIEELLALGCMVECGNMIYAA